MPRFVKQRNGMMNPAPELVDVEPRPLNIEEVKKKAYPKV